MSNATDNLTIFPYGKGGREVVLPVDGAAHLYGGTMVSQLAATKMLCPGSTASSGPCCGVAQHEVDNTDGADAALRCKVVTDGIFLFANSGSDPCAEGTVAIGAVVYMEDDHTISRTNGGAQFAAGYFAGMEPGTGGKVRVLISMRELNPTDLATLATSAGAGLVGILDAGAFTGQTTVEAALAELYQHEKSVQKTHVIPLMSFTDIDGDPLIKFNNGVADGFTLVGSKAFGYRFNDDTTAKILTSVVMPQDYDDTAAVVLHFMAAKVGATATDTPGFVVEAFAQTVGAVYDADADFGGTSSRLTNAASTTVQEVTLSLAAGDVPASPAAFTLTVVPDDLADDDLVLLAVWLEYKGKILTS